ncbi:AbrB/MazE/SpoVT family DNA-binding domain-containing protein [Clostridium sp. KNHs205]|uniref:AbrB/MazE/SpoVT family DNA-binding domain-containing protein n=1 Tax=Clostridium sp. KNHs205 TaxID=1449050 RepID=UPI00068EBD22|nr:AbrB/MazE/SpoVT family DNA-binding domain-containing protein [Clostridium sp. KNHs205]
MQYVRKIDEVGRIVIPIEIRRAAGIENRDYLDMTFENGVLKLSKGRGRRTDELGRFTIPKEIRRTNDWSIGQAMDISIDGNIICIRKFGCEWCEETEDLIEVDGHKLCRKCAEKVSAAIKQEAWSDGVCS